MGVEGWVVFGGGGVVVGGLGWGGGGSLYLSLESFTV